jgi:hypothetical protein
MNFRNIAKTMTVATGLGLGLGLAVVGVDTASARGRFHCPNDQGTITTDGMTGRDRPGAVKDGHGFVLKCDNGHVVYGTGGNDAVFSGPKHP